MHITSAPPAALNTAKGTPLPHPVPCADMSGSTWDGMGVGGPPSRRCALKATEMRSAISSRD